MCIRDSPSDRRLISLVQRLYNVYAEKRNGYDFRTISLYYELLYLLVTQYRVTEVEEKELRHNRHLNALSRITTYTVSYPHLDVYKRQVLSLFVITVLLQRVDNILSFFCGAKDSVFQLIVRLISGCDHCEVKAYDCHGIGNDRSTEVNQLLNRGLVQDQIKQTLIPLFVFQENFLKK